MKPSHQRYIDLLSEKSNVTTLDYIDGDNFNYECRTCNTKFAGSVIFKSKCLYPCPTCLKESQNKPKGTPSREEYINILTEMDYELLEKGVSFNKLQKVRCSACGHEHEIKPVQKVQAYRKYGGDGGKCIACHNRRTKANAYELGQQYVDEIKLKGYEVLSEGPYERNDNIDVIRDECGHQFNARIIYLWNGKSQCSVCNNAAKPKRLQKAHEPKLIEYRKTASEWELYKSAVAVATTKLYREYAHIINPNNYPKAKAGTEGGYQIDHILSTRLCFDRCVPVDECADIRNLQMIPWRDNISKNSNLVLNVPDHLLKYLNAEDIKEAFLYHLRDMVGYKVSCVDRIITLKNNVRLALVMEGEEPVNDCKFVITEDIIRHDGYEVLDIIKNYLI